MRIRETIVAGGVVTALATIALTSSSPQIAVAATTSAPVTAAVDWPPCAAPTGSAADDAVFDVPYETDFGTPQHEDCRTVHAGASTGFDFGKIDAPPAAEPAAHRGVDVIAHWYNDFGLDGRLTSANWNGWYDWRWNFPSRDDYDPARHPLLGFYKGDDPNVIGWISYWLAQSGVNAVSLPTNKGFTDRFWASTTGANWERELLTRTPNADALKFILGVGSTGTPDEIESRSHDLVRFATEHPERIYSQQVDGKPWAVVNTWDLEGTRCRFNPGGDCGRGADNVRAFLQRLGAEFQAAGYGGVELMARRSGAIGAANARPIPGVKVLASTYEGVYGAEGQEPATTFGDYVHTVEDRISASTQGRRDPVLGAITSMVTHDPHPSNQNTPGSTPKLFQELLQRTVDYIDDHDLPRMVTIDNVSEWAESGPGLIPQHRDGFGYLEAVRNATIPARGSAMDGLAADSPRQAREGRSATVDSENRWYLNGAAVARLRAHPASTPTRNRDRSALKTARRQ